MIYAAPPAPLPLPVAMVWSLPAQDPLDPPSFELPLRGKTTVKFKVTCAAECAVVAALTVDRPTAKRLGMGKDLTAGALTATLEAGKKTVTLSSRPRPARRCSGRRRALSRAAEGHRGLRGDGAGLAFRQLTLKR